MNSRFFLLFLTVTMSYVDAARTAPKEIYTYQQVEQYWNDQIESFIPHQGPNPLRPLYLQELRQKLLADRLSLEHFDPDLCIALHEWRRRYCIAHKQSIKQLKKLCS